MRTFLLLTAGAGGATAAAGLSGPLAGVLIATCLLFSAFFSGSEIAVLSASHARLHHLAQDGRRDARSALALLADTPRAIATTLVGTNLCNIGATSLTTALAVSAFPSHGPEIATAILTPVVLFGAEILPKALFRSRPTRLLRHSAGVLRGAAVLFAPLMAVTSAVTNGLLAIVGIRPSERGPTFRREDLEALFLFGAVVEDTDFGQGRGRQALRMAGRALDLRDRKVQEAVSILPEGLMCPADATVADAIERLRDTRAHYLAILGKGGQVEGFVPGKALLGEPRDRVLAPLAKPAYVFAPGDSLAEVLQEFRRRRQSIALVRDPGGRVLGTVTPEDVLEEITGDLGPARPRRRPVRSAPECPKRKY